jgi:PAS domain S-box-containing protein
MTATDLNPDNFWFRQALEIMPLAVTIIDLDGTILYYNRHAADHLDRKPEYIGRDVRFCHNEASSEKITRLLDRFRAGRPEPEHWELIRDGKKMFVTASPLDRDGVPYGMLHTVRVEWLA